MKKPHKPKRAYDDSVPRLDLRGVRLVNHLESEARERKGELARMRANFITYLYEHSEPI